MNKFHTKLINELYIEIHFLKFKFNRPFIKLSLIINYEQFH